MSFKMPTPGFSSSKQGSASPRTPQKSFGRQSVRVAAPLSPRTPPVATIPAPVVAQFDDSTSLARSRDDSKFARGLRQEIAPMLEDGVDQENENTKLRTELEVLRQELQDLRDASSKNDEVWQRDNIRLKEQLTASTAREATQQEQLRILDDQLSLCRQELQDIQQHQLQVEEERATATHEETGSSGLGHERELLKLVVQLVGAANVRAVLRDNPNASPAQLREILVRLRCNQCKRLSPSPANKSKETDSLHKMLFGTSSRPPSPTAIRFNSMGPRSPDVKH